jgi:hypothetical protein
MRLDGRQTDMVRETKSFMFPLFRHYCDSPMKATQ